VGVKLGLHFSCSSTTGDWPDVYQAAIEQTTLAETLGYDCAVVAEHHFMRDGWIPSPMVLCGALAAVTRRLRIGTDVVVLPLHNPVRVAEDMLVLDNLTRGRAICGVGLGGRREDFDLYRVPFEQRVSRSEEAIALIRRLMAEENVRHEGRHYRIDGATATPRPVQKPHPPIWYGAITEAGARRAARVADAMVMGPGPTLPQLVAMRKAYDEQLREQGRDPRQVPVLLRREGYIAPDDRTAWAVATEPLRYQYTSVYDWKGLDSTIADDALRQYAKDRFIVGGPETVRSEILRFAEAVNAECVIFRIQLPKLPDEKVLEAVRILGEQVLPRL
jgi:alkanesulfonate monooxygenase SsuD/methylene tetrahydromethanopterin reductase-like flavin-dependent oxidoreductase (luciferase family)